MKRRISVLVLCLLLAAPLFSAGLVSKFGIDLRGGASLFNPTDFMADYEKTLQAFGFESDDNLLTSDLSGIIPQGSALIKYMATPNVGIYFRTDFLTITDEVSVTGPENTPLADETLFISTAAFSAGYFGLGAKYYIGFDNAPGLFISIGLDGGAFMHYSSFWEIWSDPDILAGLPNYIYDEDDPDYNAYSVTDLTDVFFGGNAELGLDYLMDGKIGINVHVGYRIASSPINYPDAGVWTENNNLDSAGEKIFTASAVDFSGLYFGGGLVINIGEDGKTAGAKQQKIDGTGSYGEGGGASKYEKYGDYYYKQRKYSAAAKYFSAARKQTPRRAELYKKLGFCYYYMKNKAYAKKYLMYYLKLNPSDTQIRNWVSKLR